MSPATPSSDSPVSDAPGAALITPADQVNEPPPADADQPATAEDAADASCADYEPL
ncbi:hypothetical protein ACFYY9_19595 [Streptomyces nigra]|uniref:hypothetical protein n=1 Tax=Streptomyces TaxID=1883 RepID=UPI00131C8510|nr:hypothetical protein [Streptomyces sp. JHA19]